MINNFKENEHRESAVIYYSTFEQIKKLHARNPEQAGELAISAIELALTGELSSDDFTIELLLENIKAVNEKNKVKYDKKVESQKQKKIEDLKLMQIAELHKQGLKQKQISDRLGIPQQTISYRLGIIRSEYPELIEENKDFTNSTNFTKNTNTDNDNDNDNDNKGKIGAIAPTSNSVGVSTPTSKEKFQF